MNCNHTTTKRILPCALSAVLLASLAACGGGGSDEVPAAKPVTKLSSDRKADTTQWTIAPINDAPPSAGIAAVAATYLEPASYSNGAETNKRLWVFENGVPSLGLTAGATLKWSWYETVAVNIPAAGGLPADPLHTQEISTVRNTQPDAPMFVICMHKATANFTGVTERCSIPNANPATTNAPGARGVSLATMTNSVDTAGFRYHFAVGVLDPRTCTFKVGPISLGKIGFADYEHGYIGYVSTVPGRAAPIMNNFPADHPLAKSKAPSLAGKVCQLEVDTRGLTADMTPEMRDVVLNLDGSKSRAIKAMVTVDGDGNVLVNQAPLILAKPVTLVPKT
jgi:hypothetical protein